MNDLFGQNNRHWSLCRTIMIAKLPRPMFGCCCYHLLCRLLFGNEERRKARQDCIHDATIDIEVRVDRDMQIRLNLWNILLRRHFCCCVFYPVDKQQHTQRAITINLHFFGIFSLGSIDRSAIIRSSGSLPPDRHRSMSVCWLYLPPPFSPPLRIIFGHSNIIRGNAPLLQLALRCDEECNLNFSAAVFLSNILVAVVFKRNIYTLRTEMHILS